MLKTVSTRITSFFIAKNMLLPEQKDMCIYSLQTRILTVVTMVVLIAIGAVKSGIVNAALFVFILILLRRRTGGYHAPTAFMCFFLSVALIVTSFYVLLPILQEKSRDLIFFIYATSVSVIVIFSPVNHQNMDMTIAEIKANKSKTYAHIIAISAILGLLIIIDYDKQLILLIILSITIVACSVLISKIIGQEVKKNAKD